MRTDPYNGLNKIFTCIRREAKQLLADKEQSRETQMLCRTITTFINRDEILVSSRFLGYTAIHPLTIRCHKLHG